jgi:hypothetical protein
MSDSNFISGVHYHLKFTPSLDKGEIKCSCGFVYILLLADSGNFKSKAWKKSSQNF